ncbi:hypothetical protein BGZ83_006073 [Gryganskiella cystojenkinii]|nr:hypothetical protein BGZ83_006073 [Gryganskiella cystojenkinii]
MEGSKIKVPTLPGVYTDEASNLSRLVSSGATVPVFAHNQGLIKSSSSVRIDSWMSFMELDDVKLAKDDIFSYPLSVSLRAYFENGGGPCYLVSSDNLAAQVPMLGDVTLIVAAGENLIAQGIFSNGGLCSEGGSVFAILDGPSGELNPDLHASLGSYPEISNAAMYYPYLTAKWAKTAIPPSAAVAGAYYRNDRDRGVWKAPANISIMAGLTPKMTVTDKTMEMYSKVPLNFLSQVSGRGLVVWGARTMSPTEDFKYISVQRLSNTVRRDIGSILSRLAGEPNDQSTQEIARAEIGRLLGDLWRAGGLMGSVQEEAFSVDFVKGGMMVQEDMDQSNRMIVNVGIAPVHPAEFIILQFTQEMGQTFALS